MIFTAACPRACCLTDGGDHLHPLPQREVHADEEQGQILKTPFFFTDLPQISTRHWSLMNISKQSGNKFEPFACFSSTNIEYEIYPSYSTTISRVSLCIQSGHHPIPAIWFCVDGLNHVLMVLNSSLNFFIYCLVGKKFRSELFSFLRSLFVIGKYSSGVRVVTAVWMWTYNKHLHEIELLQN